MHTLSVILHSYLLKTNTTNCFGSKCQAWTQRYTERVPEQDGLLGGAVDDFVHLRGLLLRDVVAIKRAICRRPRTTDFTSIEATSVAGQE
jgi:hypothetical protein